MIAIGLNYLLIHYGKHWLAADIGLYFHNILRNIGSCESILDHYEHLLNTYLIIFKYYNKLPVSFLDLERCLFKVKNHSYFD